MLFTSSHFSLLPIIVSYYLCHLTFMFFFPIAASIHLHDVYNNVVKNMIWVIPQPRSTKLIRIASRIDIGVGTIGSLFRIVRSNGIVQSHRSHLLCSLLPLPRHHCSLPAAQRTACLFACMNHF